MTPRQADQERPAANDLKDLLDQQPKSFVGNRMQIDDQRVSAAGIRKLTSKYLVLYTDLRDDPTVEELPQVFDQAVPQWCEYFKIPLEKLESWQLTGMLMQDGDRFRRAGLLPDELPEFQHGLQIGFEFWVYEQPDPYFRRHLMLHEGTHGFMFHFLRGGGPPWYSEGMAELMGTHHWKKGDLSLRHTIKSKQEAPYWGRVRIIREQLKVNRAMSLSQIMHYNWTDHRNIEPYAWCWAAAAFFDHHPSYQSRFRALGKQAHNRSQSFSEQFEKELRDQRDEVVEQWQLFITEIDYGYDIARAAIIYKPTRELAAGGEVVRIRADRGWQSTGLRLQAGREYQIQAEGRYQVANQPETWWCEPGGVTIHYYRDMPLGMLTGAIRDQSQRLDGITPLANPQPIGLQRTLKPAETGTLFLRINESAANLADNQGELKVRIQLAQDAR